MKYSVCLMAIVVSSIALIVPESVKAEELISQVIYQQGYPTTVIYIPSQTTVTTTTERITTSNYPDNNYYSTDDRDRYEINRRRRQDRQPTIVIQQNNIYPGASQSNCSTSVIGSPIPSPIPLNRAGQPCR